MTESITIRPTVFEFFYAYRQIYGHKHLETGTLWEHEHV